MLHFGFSRPRNEIGKDVRFRLEVELMSESDGFRKGDEIKD